MVWLAHNFHPERKICPLMASKDCKPSLLLIAHGSRNKQANEDLYWLAEQLQKKGFELVEPAFLELAPPDIITAGRACVSKGALDVLMVPYFLAAGVHVREDLTEARDTLSKEFPDVTFRLAGHLGRHAMMVDMVLARIDEAQNPAGD